MRPLHFLLALISITFLPAAQGQTLKAYVNGGREAMVKKDYFSAYNFMRIAHEIEPNNVQYTYELATAALSYSAFTNAEKYYTEVSESEKANDYPELNYWLGYTKERLGKYQEALDLFQIYSSEHSDENPDLTALTQKHTEVCNWALAELQHADTVMELIHLGPEVNTTFSEFGAQTDDTLLYYSSLRFLINDEKAAVPGKPYSKILISEENGQGQVDTIMNDSTMHTAHTTFDGAKDRVFYTLCEYINGQDIRCDLYYRDIVDGAYGLPQKLPEPINAPGYTTTQPHVGYDPVSKREVLYFTSDRPGGKGKLDIWYCYIASKDNFTEPVNLAQLNTPFNEVAPYYHRGTDTLYFASEGYLGFGGLDIYKVAYNNGQWGEPINMGSPVNSSLDDAFYCLSTDGLKGYFSSNRLGSMYLSPEDEACCFDIYYFEKEPPPVTERPLMVRVFERRTRLPLPGARIETLDLTNATPPLIFQDPLEYKVVYMVERDLDMQATGSKKGYLPDTRKFNTSDNPDADTLVIDLFLELGNLEDFLPLAIYFDNDEPGRKSRSDQAIERYLETYDPYLARRDEFIEKYAKGVSKEDRDQAASAIAEFFDQDLLNGHREFESFLHILSQYLDDGLTFTIYLKGYTSPLASNAYNLALGNRRISSIQNEFKDFRGGILWKYMETGDLVVTQKSFGEETAPKNVSDDRKNLRKSVYSPEASRERRVEIIEIQK